MGFPRGHLQCGWFLETPLAPRSLPPAGRGGNQGRAQGLLRWRTSPPTGPAHSGVHSHVIADVSMSSHTPGSRPCARTRQWQQAVESKVGWRPSDSEDVGQYHSHIRPWLWPEAQRLDAVKHNHLTWCGRHYTHGELLVYPPADCGVTDKHVCRGPLPGRETCQLGSCKLRETFHLHSIQVYFWAF